jgi:hypothetical protein
VTTATTIDKRRSDVTRGKLYHLASQGRADASGASGRRSLTVACVAPGTHATTTENTPFGEHRQQRAVPCHKPAFGDTYRTMKLSLVLGLGLGLTSLVGCGDNGGSGGGEPVVVNASGAKLAAIHDGNSWKQLPLDAQGKATPSIDGPTLIAAVCDDVDFMNFYTIGVGPGGGQVDMYCGASKTAATVAIAAPTTTQVFAGFGRATGGKSMTIGNGTYDIVAIDTSLSPPRVEIRRGVAVTASTTLTFDLATAGTPMQQQVRVDVTGEGATDVIERRVSYTAGTRTEPTVASWTVNGTDAFVVPASLLRTEDTHLVHGSTTDEALGTRSVSHDVAGKETSVALVLPAYVASAQVAFGAAPSITWQGDARFDQLYFGINSRNFEELWDVLLLPSWALAGGDTATLTIPDPHAIPGWDVAWDLPSAGALEWFLSVEHDAAPDHIRATRTGTL